MSDNNLEIEFSLSGLSKVLSGFKEVGQEQEKAAKQGAKAGRSIGVSGPYQRRTALREKLSEAMVNGNADALKDVNRAIRLNERQIKREQPRGLGQRLGGVISSSRFSVGGEGGGHLMPLVGKTLEAIGGEGALGALGEAAGALGAVAGVAGAVVTAIIAAGKALFDMTEKASEASTALYRISLLSGGSGKETGALSALARGVGISPSQIAGIGGGLHGEITDGSYGQAMGLRLGISDAPGPYGKVDQASQILQALSSLRGMTPNEQTVALRSLPSLQPLAGTLAQSQSQFNREKGDGLLNSKILSPQFAQQSADFQGALGRVSDAWDRLMASASPELMRGFTSFANNLADAMDSLSAMANRNLNNPAFMKVVDTIEAVVDALSGDISGAASHLQNIINGRHDNNASLDRNTNALDRNTQVQAGTYGKITRDGALPAGLGGTALQKTDLHRIRLSAF